MTEKDILKLIGEDEWMMNVLRAVNELNLPDWMIGAGFVRGKVWDVLHDYSDRTPLGDIDVLYFDSSDTNELSEKKHDSILKEKMDEPWSCKNQARMHVINNQNPFTSSENAIEHWVETPTCVAVKIDKNGNLQLIAPYGIDDLTKLIVRVTPKFVDRMEVYYDRINKKNWKSKWPKLEILYR